MHTEMLAVTRYLGFTKPENSKGQNRKSIPKSRGVFWQSQSTSKPISLQNKWRFIVSSPAALSMQSEGFLRITKGIINASLREKCGVPSIGGGEGESGLLVPPIGSMFQHVLLLPFVTWELQWGGRSCWEMALGGTLQSASVSNFDKQLVCAGAALPSLQARASPLIVSCCFMKKDFCCCYWVIQLFCYK